MNKKLIEVLIERLSNLNDVDLEKLKIETKRNKIEIEWSDYIINTTSGSFNVYKESL